MMTVKQLREAIKGLDDNTSVIIYDSLTDDQDYPPCFDDDGNLVDGIDPALFLRHPKWIDNTSDFKQELEYLGETNVILLRI